MGVRAAPAPPHIPVLFLREIEIGIATCSPAESISKSGLNFLRSASANGLRYAFSEQTNRTFIWIHYRLKFLAFQNSVTCHPNSVQLIVPSINS